ncbi:unnamed protein product [Cuscuta campestris]|uniref:ARC105/Med15 mediator subunit C-terminal domain-containing protein n=1 Tax=Cuscuta campestris TaxID=132261 RepID=A0A484MVE7_9ASTE|nr:unnamed protein product [Cuscuta campestris]
MNYSQQAKTSEAPVLNCAFIQPSPSRDPYSILESSMDLKTCLPSYVSQVSQPHTLHPNQLSQLLMQVSQQCNNQSFVMQPTVQHSSSQMEQWSMQANRVQFSQPMTLQDQWRMDWLGNSNNNMSTLQYGLQSARQNFAANQQKYLPAVYGLDVPHHSRPTTTIPGFLHLASSQNLTDPSPQSSSQTMNTSSILSSQKPMGHLQGKSSGFSSSMSQTEQPNSSEWSDNAYQQLQVMREIYSVDVIKMYKKAQELCVKPSNPELSVNYEKGRVFLEKIIKFFHMSKNEFLQIPKEKVCHYMNIVTNYLDQVRLQNTTELQKHLQQLQVPNPPLLMRQTGNAKFQFNHSISGPSSSAPQSSSNQELSLPKSFFLNPSGDVSNRGHENAEASSRSATPDGLKWPLHPNLINFLQNANMSEASQSFSQSDPKQMRSNSRLPGPVTLLDNSTLTIRDHATPLAANTSTFASAVTLSQKTKQPMWQTTSMHGNSASAFGFPLTKIMQFEGQKVTEHKKLTEKSNDFNDPKVKHAVGSNVRTVQPNHVISKPSKNLCQTPPSTSSQLPPMSPQISQHPIPLSTISPTITPSPLTPLTPTSVPESPQKVSSSLGLSSSAEGSKAPTIQSQPAKLDSQLISSSGMLEAPLVMKTRHSEGNQQSTRPFKRLLDAIGSISEKSLSAAARDIGNIVNMVDMRPGALCYGDFRDPIRDDLMADVRSFIQKAKLCRHETIGNGKMKRNINAIVPNVSPTSLEESDCVDWSNYTSPHTLSMATAVTKFPNTQLTSTVVEEIKETNRKLVETLVEMVVGSSEDVPKHRAEENIIIKCSYSPMGYCEKTIQPYLPSRTRFPEMLVLQLLVPEDYPNVSPIVLDKSPDLCRDSGEEVQYGYEEVKLRFTASLRQLSEPMSIREMAKTWDSCAREVFSEFMTHQMGGGRRSFSSVHGAWEECDAAAA